MKVNEEKLETTSLIDLMNRMNEIEREYLVLYREKLSIIREINRRFPNALDEEENTLEFRKVK